MRGLAEGRDMAVYWEEQGKGRFRRAARAIDFGRRRVKRTIRNGLARRSDIGVPLWQFPMILGIMAVFSALMVMGAWTQALLPARCSRGWQI
jgi:hypothetical protein